MYVSHKTIIYYGTVVNGSIMTTLQMAGYGIE